MPTTCHPTIHEWLVYAVDQPLAWLVAEVCRRLGPVVRVPLLGTVVSDAHIGRQLLQQDDRFTKAGPGSVGALVTQVMGQSALINMDGAAHRALREQLRDLFAPSYVETLVSTALAEPLEFLSCALSAGRTVDLVAFMRQLSGRVTCQMLGIDVAALRASEVNAEIHGVGEQLAANLRLSARPLSQAQVAAARGQIDRLTAHARTSYLENNSPPGSIIGRLRDLGLGFDEVKGILSAVLVAGVQPVSVALPRIVALLLDTGEWRRLQNQPELAAAAVDEGLRCCVPIPATIRSVARDTVVGGHRFAAGTRAFVFTYNLAKDPGLFPSPQRFDITRPSNGQARHLWYGSGPHFCLGFALAQRELCAVLEALVHMPGRLRVVRRRYARHVLLPGYARLDVRTLPP